MTIRPVSLVILTAVLCSPLWAWRTVGDDAVLKQQYQAFVDKAMAEADKCLTAQPADLARARFFLLAVADLCVPAGGYDPKVPEATVTAYKTVVARGWATDVPDEATFTAMLRANEEKLDQAYINAFSIADSADTYTVKTVAEEFAKAASKYPAALALCLEIAGKSIAPEAYMKYGFEGDARQIAREAQGTMANLFGGPDTIQAMCKETFVPNALEEGKQELARAASTNDPDMLKMYAKFAQEYVDFIAWADPENAGGKELAAQTQAVRDRAKKIYEAQIAASRVPPNRYTGGDAEALRQQMKAVFKFEMPHTVLRIVITSPQWEEKPHVWTGYNAVDVGWYKLIDGAVVIKRTGDGTCWVHPVTFGRRWLGHGDDYGDLVVYGWADNYQILPEWVNK
jgi:hypothetical protein